MKEKRDVFLEFPCFFYDPVNVGNLISGSSAFSKSMRVGRGVAHFWLVQMATFLNKAVSNLFAVICLVLELRVKHAVCS